MSQQLTLDDAPRQRPVERVRAGLLNTQPTPVHTGDPETATAASAAAALRAPTLRRRVLLAFWAGNNRGRHTLNDYELSAVLGVLRTSAGKRRLELQRLGLVEDSGARRATDTSTSAVCWRLTSEGKRLAEQLAKEDDR